MHPVDFRLAILQFDVEHNCVLINVFSERFAVIGDGVLELEVDVVYSDLEGVKSVSVAHIGDSFTDVVNAVTWLDTLEEVADSLQLAFGGHEQGHGLLLCLPDDL